MASQAWHHPIVGEGATKILYTDRNPCTVVRVSDSGRTCWLQEDNYERTDGGGMTDTGQAYAFTPNPDAPEIEVMWTGKRWKQAGKDITFVIGRREKYHDFSF